MQRADILLDVIDATSPLDREEVAGWRRGIGASQHCLAVYNKIDLVESKAATLLSSEPESVVVSARTGQGMDNLRACLLEVVGGKEVESVPIGVTNSRHVASLMKAKEALHTALQSLKHGATNEFIAFDVRDAANHLAEITGEITSEEILNEIFGRFCIGK
jgi:tRNA modification GTPase